ncbi:hypothetical protein SCLCIDRAFT_1209471 [Scleroderma citrinum Foug A]|uniref:Uncharacterized protein n=1 Tax=Scleroderma citrinum Foug A TaxID=1036808 RepID=A0A0C3A380_9AGAM|nr:hypothetical protein SCLCIDRAFT_1209471 [Scleroderma citrinum Foug A]
MVSVTFQQSWKGLFRVNNSKAVIPNAHTSASVDASPFSSISGAIQFNVPPCGPETDIENEEILNSERSKS